MDKKHIELRKKIDKGLDLAIKELIEEKQKNDSYLVVTDDDGNVIRKPAREFKV